LPEPRHIPEPDPIGNNEKITVLFASNYYYMPNYQRYSFFLYPIKAKRDINRINSSMRQHRILAQGVWYEIRTVINNREPLFRRKKSLKLFAQVFREVEKLFSFEIRGLRVEADRVSFYINAADGFQLPDIMQWWKQTFSVRFNLECGRSGHVWGERYWSVVLGREPPEEAVAETAAGVAARLEAQAEVCEDNPAVKTGARPYSEEKAAATGLSPE
jgi:REP element-mobilizing transposase RayT